MVEHSSKVEISPNGTGNRETAQTIRIKSLAKQNANQNIQDITTEFVDQDMTAEVLCVKFDD